MLYRNVILLGHGLSHRIYYVHVVIYTLALRIALADGEADVAYCRVMLLGPAGVGKTSFRRGLMSETFNPDNNSTTLADVSHVTSVINREWMKCDEMNKWCKVSIEDEIDELSKLMMIVKKSHSGQPHKTSSLSYQISKGKSHFKRVEQLMEREIIKKAMEKAQEMKEVDTSLQCLQPFFHLWDCGGQPVFLEVLPIFLTCRTMFLLFFDATKDLKERWMSVYRHENGEETSPEVVNCTTLEMIERWMGLIYLLQKDDTSELSVIPIGTKRDKIARSMATEIQQELDKFLDGKIFNQILNEVVFVNNKTSGMCDKEDPSYEKVRRIVFNFTSELLRQKTPVPWVLFRKFLQLAARELKINVITLDEACAIGSHCNVKQEHISLVLLFYHELGVILHYPQIEGLQDKVILSPQWFVNCLGMILAPLPSSQVKGYEFKNEWQLLRGHGILVEKLYTRIWNNCDSLDPDSMVELLTHFQLAVEIEGSIETHIKYDRHKKKYFIPAVLPYTPLLSSLPSDDSNQIKAAPLHIMFNTGFAIPSFFTRLCTTMLNVKNDSHPKLSLYFKDGIYHNMVKYKLESLPTAFVTLTEYSNVIDIQFVCSSKLLSHKVQSHCNDLKVSKNMSV